MHVLCLFNRVDADISTAIKRNNIGSIKIPSLAEKAKHKVYLAFIEGLRG